MRLCEYAVTTYIDTAFPQHQLPEADRRAVIRFIKCQLFRNVHRLDQRRDAG